MTDQPTVTNSPKIDAAPAQAKPTSQGKDAAPAKSDAIPVGDVAPAAAPLAASIPAPKAKALKAAVVKAAPAAAKPAKTVRPAAKLARKAAKPVTAPKISAVRAPSAPAQERTDTMNMNAFNFGAYDTVPGFAPFTNLFATANERGQELAKQSQAVAEEFADLAKANVEAMVEAGKIAVEGSKALGQDLIATSRDGVEQASDAIRSLAEAKSPTEYVQLQGEFARASFDRMVAETSKLTEAMVKLAGEAFQPIQNRASANAERFNSFVA